MRAGVRLNTVGLAMRLSNRQAGSQAEGALYIEKEGMGRNVTTSVLQPAFPPFHVFREKVVPRLSSSCAI